MDTPRHLVLALSCRDRPGIVHAVSGLLARTGGNVTESQQFGDPGTGLFFMRVQVETPASRGEIDAGMGELAETFGMAWTLDVVGRPMRTLLLVSKEAHCLADLLFRARHGRLPIEVVAVLSNHGDLEPTARFHGVPFVHVRVDPTDKAPAEAALLALVERESAEMIVLARYMQVLSNDVCTRLHGRILNIHHSFLPSFKGARPYAQAHARGVKIIGATAHYVTADLDEGPIIEQDIERVDHSDDVRELIGIGQDVERRVLARAVRWHAEHRVFVNGRRTVVFH
jgi:formyltetrahydrofolate deformylase